VPKSQKIKWSVSQPGVDYLSIIVQPFWVNRSRSRRNQIFRGAGLHDGSARLLLLCVRWAKSVPTFLQLTFRDQAILLEESWSELFILTAAQLGIPVELLGKQTPSVCPSPSNNYVGPSYCQAEMYAGQVAC